MQKQTQDPQLIPAVVFGQPIGPYFELIRQLGTEVICLDAPHSHAAPALRRAITALGRFDLHHFHSAEPLLMIASLCCHGARRYYTHRGGVTDYSAKQRMRYRITGLLVRRFAGLSGNTEHAAASGAALLGIQHHRFAVTYNGVEFELLEPRIERGEMQRRFGLRDGSFVIGTVAHLRKWKRIDRLIDALAALSDPSLQLLIVGAGEDLPRLKSLATRRSLNGQVIFAGEQTHVGDFLQLMDGFCLPSTGLESFGNAAVEAMAAGVPSIVFSDGGGLLEHIVPGRTGLVVRDEAELVTAIRRLVDDPELRSSLGRAGRNYVRASYTLTRAADRYRELYGIRRTRSIRDQIVAEFERTSPAAEQRPHERVISVASTGQSRNDD